MVNLKPNEESFEIKPVGIRYKCEFCHEGEMKYDHELTSNNWDIKSHMYTHKCTKCDKTMFLPKIYPYIEWIPV